MSTIPEPAVIQARLMGITLPCNAGCDNGAVPDMREGSEEKTRPCARCQGSGLRYSLRLKCRHCGGLGTVDLDYGQASFYIGCSHCGGHQSPQVPNRSDVSEVDKGTGFIFNPDPDALTEAVRAKGWFVTLMQYGKGDQIYISLIPYGDVFLRKEFISSVHFDEGLRGQAALQLAVYRAMEATE